jgi:zinc transporter 1/2/3
VQRLAVFVDAERIGVFNSANIVSGVLDSIISGISIHTELVELLARDYVLELWRAKDNKRLGFVVFCVLLGAGIMALLGVWAINGAKQI